MSLERKIIHYLKANQQTLGLAESCTGGLLAHRLTNIPGSSLVFKAGIIAYNNEAKTQFLKIPAALITKKGAVSADVALKMAAGARKLFKTDFGIGITGIAGPDGGTRRKPVGLTYIAVSTKLESICIKCVFPGRRHEIKRRAANQAFNILLEFLT